MASVAASLGGAWSLPVKSSLPFSLTSTSRSLVLHRAELARRCGSPPAGTAPAVSPTTAPPLASSAAETAGPNSPPSSGQPGGQASTSLTPPSAPRAGAESASARSPTPVTAESSTEPEDSAVGSTSPPLSSASSAPSQPTSVSLGLRSGADDSLSSPPEATQLQTSGPPMVSLPCSVSLRAPLVEGAAGPRFPDAPPLEPAEELDEFFQQASPKSAPTDSATSSGEGLSTPPRTPRSIFRRRLDEKPFPIVESPPKPSLDDPAMHPASPASPIGSPPEVPSPGGSPVSSVARSDIYSPLSTPSPSPLRASVPPGFRPDGLLEAGVPPLPKPSPVQAKPAASSPVRRSPSPPSTSLSAPSSASPAGSRPNSIAELWEFLRRWEAERDSEDRTRTQLTAYALMRSALPTDFALRRDLLRARSFGDMLDVLRANTAEPPSSTKELAELRVQNAKLTQDNQALLRPPRHQDIRAGGFLPQHSLRVGAPAERVDSAGQPPSRFLPATGRPSTSDGDQRDKDLKRMSEVLAERDVAYSAPQGVASSYFEQVQEAAAVISSGGADRALWFTNHTIDNQRRVIQRQKNVLRYNGRISVVDPALALAAAAGIDAPGLSPGDLALNARLCRLLEARWPELSQVQSSEVREITLRVSGPVVPSSAPVSLPLSSAAPTSNSSAAGLAMTPTDFHVPSAEPRRVPGSPFRRDHLTPVTRPSVHVSASSSVPLSGSAVSAAPTTSSAGLVSSMVVTSAPESTARPLPAVSAGLVSSTPPLTRRTSPQATKASAGSTSKSARKSPTKAAAGSSPRSPRNSAASPKSTSTVAPALSITGSARSQRASALNARAINNLELQALEASDAEVLGWSSGAANSAARATSASSPLVIDSPSSPVVTPTPTPVGTSSGQHQSSSDDSADDEVALQRSRRLRKKSVVEGDESSDSVTEALEEKPASPLTPASVSPAPATGQKRPSSPVAPASTKKARASASAKSSSPPRPVVKSASRVRPTAKSSKAAKSAIKTARGLPSLAIRLMLAQVPWRPPRNGQGIRRPLRAHALARRFKRRSWSPSRPEPDELG
ncbi:unnamed protein product [Phytophthora fragariaefolia]|uniref:Unnamed protein product n=1 Tax=Phytophthora fragariaefolia TaxID=1490495 RepID=A0A9W7CKH2_9STRA|nr:unnamed protein product [Phytophthora fragariaefolia]